MNLLLPAQTREQILQMLVPRALFGLLPYVLRGAGFDACFALNLLEGILGEEPEGDDDRFQRHGRVVVFALPLSRDGASGHGAEGGGG